MCVLRWKKSRKTKVFTKVERATHNLADLLKESYEESMQELLDAAKINCTVWHDLLGAALSEVRWDTIAKHLIEEVTEPES